MNSAAQIVDGMKESTGVDLGALLAGVVGGKIAAAPKQEVQSEAKAASTDVEDKEV